MKWSTLRDEALISLPARLHYAASRAAWALKGRPKARFAVVVPCYNNPAFLLDTARSIAAQRLPPIQVIFVNDGRFESTRQVIRQAVALVGEARSAVIEQDNLGVAAARNAGIQAAEAEWIVPLDYDDHIAPGYLERLAVIAGADPRVELIYPHSLKTNTPDPRWVPRQGPRRRILDRCLYPAFSAFKRDLWARLGGYDPSHPLGMDDWDLFIRAVMGGARLQRLPFFMGTWRGHDMNETHVARRNWRCGRAMIVTLSHRWRDKGQVLAALDQIADMGDDVHARVERKTAQFPELPFPHAWLALAALRRGDVEAATHAAEALARLNASGDWLLAHVTSLVQDRLARA